MAHDEYVAWRNEERRRLRRRRQRSKQLQLLLQQEISANTRNDLIYRIILRLALLGPTRTENIGTKERYLRLLWPRVARKLMMFDKYRHAL